MPHITQNGWEPDPKKIGNWRSMFESPRPAGQPPGAPPPMPEPVPMRSDAPFDDAPLAPDPSVYRPWTLQRGSSRPSLMLDFRRYEPRSGLWSGWAIGYPYLVGMEYTGDRMVSLDFGKSQVMVEGRGLEELVRHIQQGTVLALYQYDARIWPILEEKPVILLIEKIC